MVRQYAASRLEGLFDARQHARRHRHIPVADGRHRITLNEMTHSLSHRTNAPPPPRVRSSPPLHACRSPPDHVVSLLLTLQTDCRGCGLGQPGLPTGLSIMARPEDGAHPMAPSASSGAAVPYIGLDTDPQGIRSRMASSQSWCRATRRAMADAPRAHRPMVHRAADVARRSGARHPGSAGARQGAGAVSRLQGDSDRMSHAIGT